LAKRLEEPAERCHWSSEEVAPMPQLEGRGIAQEQCEHSHVRFRRADVS
jgi:hypothetical protein